MTWRTVLRNEQVVLTLLAAVIGVVVGYAAILFRLAIMAVQAGGFGFTSERVHLFAAQLPWWHVVLVPTLGGVAIALFLRHVMPGRRPLGVAEVIEAAALKGGRMTVREGLGAAVVSAASLGFGASTGREGPIVHLGAALAASIARRLSLGASLSVTVLGCGVASAVAASFNAPIAGVLFALEVVVGHYAVHAFAPVVIAAVAGTLVSHAHLGNFPAFIIPDYRIASILEFPAFMLLGLVSAAVAIIFMRSIMFTDEVARRVPLPDWCKAALGGLAVGLIALVYPHVLGVGYGATDDALGGRYSLLLLLALIAAKTAATSISLAARFGGGVFSPSLFLGAMTGAAFGAIAAAALPEFAADTGVYAIVGMGAVAAAVLGAPISTVLIVFELTSDYQVTVAVMVAVAIASVLTQQSLGRSFFHWQLERRGLNLKGGRVRHLLTEARVRDIMSTDFERVPQASRLREIEARLRTAPDGRFLVIDERGCLVGSLTFADIKDVAFDPVVADLINARDVARAQTTTLMPDDTLEHALALMDASGEERVPVVADEEECRLLGVVDHKQVLLAYNRALLAVHAEEHGER